MKEKSRKRSREQWEDDNYRQKITEAMKKVWEDDKYRQKTTESMKKLREDNNYRQKQSETIKKLWEDENYRQKNTEAMNKPECRQKKIEANQKMWETRIKPVLIKVRVEFEDFWKANKHVNITRKENYYLGNVVNNIRTYFGYVIHSPELAVWLKERGFKMNTVNEVKNAQKWVELEKKWAQRQQVLS